MTGVAVSNRRTGNTNRGGRRGGLDMAGLLFEKLTVIRRATDEEVRALKWSNFTSARWLCRCSCGANKIALGSNLRNHSTKSCGAAGCKIGPKQFNARPRHTRPNGQ
jgi:hypothetical protein